MCYISDSISRTQSLSETGQTQQTTKVGGEFNGHTAELGGGNPVNLALGHGLEMPHEQPREIHSRIALLDLPHPPRTGLSPQEGHVARGEITPQGFVALKTWSGDMVPISIPEPTRQSAGRVFSNFMRALFVDGSPSSAFRVLQEGRKLELSTQQTQQISDQVKTRLSSDRQARIAFAILPQQDRLQSIRESVSQHYPDLPESFKNTLSQTIYNSAMDTLNETTDTYRQQIREENKLGEGGNSRVYRSQDQDYVIKIPKAPDDERVVGNFRHEAIIRTHLSVTGGEHENVVGLGDFCVQEGELMSTEPFMPGKRDGEKLIPLLFNEDLRKEAGLTESDVSVIKFMLVHDAVEGLAFMHEHGICHNDLKPANILIDSSNGSAKWSDFGTCRFMGDRQQYQGTPEYMAPELLRGGTGVFTGQSDVYSLGVMMGQIFSGEKPYPDAQGIADIRSTRRIDNSPVFSEHTDKELNRLTEGLYQRMLDKDPNKRPTVQDLRREFAMDPGAVSYARGKLLALIQAANRH